MKSGVSTTCPSTSRFDTLLGGFTKLRETGYDKYVYWFIIKYIIKDVGEQMKMYTERELEGS